MTRTRLPIVVVMTTLALTALFLARGATELASLALLGAPARPARAPAPPASSGGDDRACAILARNAFDGRGSLSCEEPAVVREEPPQVATTAEPAACDGALRLMGTYVRRDARPPLALVARGADASQVVTVGDSVESGVVTRVEMDRIELALEGSTCTLAMFREHEEAPQLVTARPAPALEGLRVSGDHVALDRSTIDRALRDPRLGLGRLRAVPTTASDGSAALRLLGIGRDHPLAALGVRSGDLVRALDGRSLDGADAWLDALAIARRPGSHTVELERAGERRTVVVEIADR